MDTPFRFSQPVIIGLIIFSLGATFYVWNSFQATSYQCDPHAAESSLADYTSQGIHGTNHPPSLSNLLWIHVGPKWHSLPQSEKEALDKVVRCAATTIDDNGQPNWQAAYYDQESGKLVALTSKRYGFRLKTP